jgi:alginate O-acetyltransferase complex protein AlgI
VNLMLTMLLGGLWHGASWNFLIWGAIHGGMLAFERKLGRQGGLLSLPRFARVGVTFLVVLVSWVFFRAADLRGATTYLQSMAGFGPVQEGAGLLAGILYQPYYLLCLLLAGVVVWACPDTWEWTQSVSRPRAVACLLLFWVSLIILATQAYNPFIYFIF